MKNQPIKNTPKSVFQKKFQKTFFKTYKSDKRKILFHNNCKKYTNTHRKQEKTNF